MVTSKKDIKRNKDNTAVMGWSGQLMRDIPARPPLSRWEGCGMEKYHDDTYTFAFWIRFALLATA